MRSSKPIFIEYSNPDMFGVCLFPLCYWHTVLTDYALFAILVILFPPSLRGRTRQDMPCLGSFILTHAMLTKKKKQNLITKYQTHKGDTGSTEVQIAILTAEIEELAKHLKEHHKDHSSRRGLLRKVGERRRLLRYLKKENSASFELLVKGLKLKQAKEFEKPSAIEDDIEGIEPDENGDT